MTPMFWKSPNFWALVFFLSFQGSPLKAADCGGPSHIKKNTARYKVDVAFPTLPDVDLNCEVRRDMESDLARFEDLLDQSPQPPRRKGQYYSHNQFFKSDLGTKSLVVNRFENPGGAHPVEYTRTYTYDVSTGKKYFFLDLFSPQVDWHSALWPFVKKVLWPLNKDKDWILKGASSDPANYSRFILKGRNLVVYFEPYSVAPYSAGMIQVKIPLESIIGVLAPTFAKRLSAS